MHDFNNVALGAEADLSFTNLNAGFDGAEGIGVDANMLSSLRLRAGLTNGPVMPYVTAGVGLGNFRYTQDGDWFQKYGSSSVDKSKIGFVVGGGLEAKLTGNWSGRVEGLYYAFGSDSGIFPQGNYPWAYPYTVDSNVFVVRAGLNYNFGN